MAEWRAIAEYPDYEVSDEGQVRRVSGGRGAKPGRILRPATTPRGYLIVSLYRDGRSRMRKVHRLLCTAFHGDPPTPKHHAAHDDGDFLNNTPGNVLWKTALENSADMLRHGRRPRGETHWGAKLSSDDVVAIRASTELHKVIAKRFGISSSHVCSIKKGVFWNDV